MSFRHVKGPALQEFYPKTASTTLTLGACVVPASGQLVAATAGTTRVFGVLQVSSVSTDSDFASTTKLPVLLPRDNDEFEVDLTSTTTFAATFVGLQCDLDATGQFVNPTSATHKQCTILRQGSATSKAIVKINGAYTFNNAA